METQRVVTPTSEAGLEPLHFLKSTDPPLWLAPSPSLSKATRMASQHLFSILKPFSPKSPFDHLLVDGFDAEQIWQQIDLQSHPLLARVRRDLKRFEKHPEEISNLKVGLEDKKKVIREMVKGFGEERDDFEEGIEEFDEEEEEEDDEEGEEDIVGEQEDGDTEEGEKEESSDEDEEEGSGAEIEDGFLRIKELEEFMEEEEEREYGLQKNKNSKKEKKRRDKVDDEIDDDDDGEDDELGEFDLGDDGDEDASKLENSRYEDFFGAKQKNSGRRKSKVTDGSEDSDSDDGDIGALEKQKSENLSTHEKQLKKLQSEIELMEKANLEPKTWTMQGEVTAAKRPKNSALEVDLDFEHNVRPAPVITEEVTATLEEMIQKRIIEGRFDDVQKAPKRPTKAPREIKDLDENKSKKGLGEIYEQEYVEKTNLASAPSSFKDETKKEATILFKKLCLKLDALSHFHFAPKPVIEDMSIQANVPALAMEEIAPVAVSDAAMLAPEEVFAGKGDIKEAAELTQSERKRRRANKKRRYKAMVAKRDTKKARNTAISNPNEG